MKVLFTFGGLPHYYNYILSILNKVDGLEIVVVVPEAKGKTIGKGVFQTTEGINFKLIRTTEYKAWYRKTFLRKLSQVIKDENPEIIVLIWPYILRLIFDPFFLFLLMKRNIKIVYKSIPFAVPEFIEGLSFTYEIPNEDNSVKKDFKSKLGLFFLTLLRRVYFNIVDLHINYVDRAYSIFRSYGVPEEKIFVIYNSPNTEILLDAKVKAGESGPILSENPYRIIHVGRLVKWKKVDLLIKAISVLKNKFDKIELIVVGSGPEENSLKGLAKRLYLENNVKFIGPVYDPVTLGKYFNASSIYVLAGMGGLSINEAMAFEKPVICSVCDGTEKKLVREDFNGKFFKEDDPDDLIKKIDQLLNDKEKIIRMGKNSFSIIKNEVNIHTVINGYIRAFNYLTNNKYNLVYKK